MVSCAIMAIVLIVGLLLAAMSAFLWYLTRSSQRVWKVSARVAAVMLACISALSLLLFLFTGAMCGRYEFPPVPSTDGRVVAQVEEEDCGAVDSFHSSVQLLRHKRGAFVSLFRLGEPTTVLTIGHDPRLIGLEWADASTLRIRYPDNYRDPTEFRCQGQWEDVQIQCIPYNPEHRKAVGQMPPVTRWLW
jgi:hypothetical protein